MRSRRCATAASIRSRKKVVPHVLTRKYGTGMAMQFIAKDVKIAVDSAHSIERCRAARGEDR